MSLTAARKARESDGINEDLTVLSNAETEFLPITTRAYLYLSGTPFKALATGEYIEKQIFNWTYTDEQRAKAAFAAMHPAKCNLYGALPQMRLLTCQMPDELLAIANGGEFDEFDLNAFFDAKGEGAAAEFKHKFRRYEDASMRYAGIESHTGLTHYGLYDTVVARY